MTHYNWEWKRNPILNSNGVNIKGDSEDFFNNFLKDILLVEREYQFIVRHLGILKGKKNCEVNVSDMLSGYLILQTLVRLIILNREKSELQLDS